jgi:hypothetical protein
MGSSPAASNSQQLPSVRVHRSLESVRPIGPALDALNRVSRRPTPFASLEYLEAFEASDEHGVAGQVPLLLVIEVAGLAIGWVALRVIDERALGLRTKRVAFFTTHDVDRPGLVCRPEDEGRCADAVWRYLLEEEGADAIELMAQDESSPLLPRARHLPGWRVRTFDSIPNSTILFGGMSLFDWFGSLQKKYRQRVGRQSRRLFAAGRVELLTARRPEALGPFLDLYLDLERRSWKSGAGAGIGRHPKRVALFRTQCLPGRAAEPVIHLLTLDDLPVAGMFGVDFAGGFYGREIAFDEDFAAMAPGNLLMLLTIGETIKRGGAFVNLLGFFGYYKSRWGATATATRGVQLLRRWSAPWAMALVQAARRRLRPAAAVAEAGAFNPARREAIGDGPPDGASEAPPPDRRVERALLRDTLASLAPVLVDRVGGAALDAALPFPTVEEPVVVASKPPRRGRAPAGPEVR